MKKIITILIIINLILIGTIYNFINKGNINNQKKILKEMTETEYEDYITELNQSHEDYANYIEESKKKIASAITDMGVTTSNEESLETMANNIKSISRSNNIDSIYHEKSYKQSNGQVWADVTYNKEYDISQYNVFIFNKLEISHPDYQATSRVQIYCDDTLIIDLNFPSAYATYTKIIDGYKIDISKYSKLKIKYTTNYWSWYELTGIVFI